MTNKYFFFQKTIKENAQIFLERDLTILWVVPQRTTIEKYKELLRLIICCMNQIGVESLQKLLKAARVLERIEGLRTPIHEQQASEGRMHHNKCRHEAEWNKWQRISEQTKRLERERVKTKKGRGKQRTGGQKSEKSDKMLSLTYRHTTALTWRFHTNWSLVSLFHTFKSSMAAS